MKRKKRKKRRKRKKARKSFQVRKMNEAEQKITILKR
jgi:hypothetical protein